MKLFVRCPLALTFALGAFAFTQGPYSFRLKEKIHDPLGWERVAPAPADHIIRLRIGLSQANFSELERHLQEISDPSHSRYGQHLSKAEVEGLVAPKQESIAFVDDWLASFGLGQNDLSRSPAGDWVIVNIPVHVAENMLNTNYYVWQFKDTNDYLVRTTEYYLPSHLHDHVDLVQPTNLFARWSKMRTTSFFEDDIAQIFDDNPDATLIEKIAACREGVTIGCLQELYNFRSYIPAVPKQNAIGITSYLEENINNQDLQDFYKVQRPEAVGSGYRLISVHGKCGKNDQNISNAGSEANLDSQFAFGLTWPTQAVAWTTAGRPPFKPDNLVSTNTNEPYQDWMDAALAEDHLPQTISTSYGEEEQTSMWSAKFYADREFPFSYAVRTCNSIAQLGARGVSMIFSSGDYGVGDGSPDPEHQACQTNNGRNETRFMPTFPASCPYSTSVGGTTNIPEEGVYFSGGGFSDYFSRPSYQSHAVQGYLDQLPKGLYSGLYNTTGRGFPDVAAMSRGFRIYVKGRPTSIGGTSASAPTFAAVIALLNDIRLSKKQPPLGFLNHWLYGKGLAGLDDITVGNNPGCGTQGFNASKGWDPVTGLGVPDFEKMKKHLPSKMAINREV